MFAYMGGLQGESGVFTSYCSVYLSSAQALITDTETKIEFDTALWDNDSEFDLVTNHRFVAKTTGIYHVTTQLLFLVLLADTLLQISIKVNGTVKKMREFIHHADAITYDFSPLEGDIQLGVGDYIEITAKHTAGSNKDINAIDYVSYLDIHRVI